MGRNNGSPIHETSSKYKAYVASVDKALKAFEYTTEWADLIKALGSLTKVFQQYTKIGELPRAPTVSKRLSQCLHPALPSGVHLKALETFRQIFIMLGKDGLPKHLHLFAVGLFPVMGFAGIRVKTELIKILNEFLLPLGSALKPSTVGLVAGVLQGLEEGSDFYDSINEFLERVQQSVGADYLFTCIWECIRSVPTIRLPALIFIGQHFDKKASMDDQLYVMGTSVETMVGIMVCSLCEACSTVTDQALLVQRNLLDFVIAAFPVNSEQLVRTDMVRLMRSILFIVFRREMSLNRRLYSWLLNCSGQQVTAVDVGSEQRIDLTFFKSVSLPIMFDAFQLHLKSAKASGQPLSAVNSLLRLLAYLLDKGELGTVVLDNTLIMLLNFMVADVTPETSGLNVLSNLPSEATCSTSISSLAQVKGQLKQKTHQRNASTVSMMPSAGGCGADANRADFLRVVNMLVTLTDSDYLWTYLQHNLSCIINRNLNDRTQCQLTLNQFVKVVDLVLCSIDLDAKGSTRISHILDLIRHVLDVMQHGLTQLTVDDRLTLFECIAHLLPEVYVCPQLRQSDNNEDVLRLQRAFDSYLVVLSDTLYQALTNRHTIRAVPPACRLLTQFADFALHLRQADWRKDDNDDLSTAFDNSKWLTHLCSLSLRPTYDECLQCIDTLMHISQDTEGIFQGNGRLREYLERKEFWMKCAHHLWRLLGSSDSQHDNQVTALLNTLHSRHNNNKGSHCELVIMQYFADKNTGVQIEGVQLFLRYWTLSKAELLTEQSGRGESKSLIPMHRASITLLMMLYSDDVNETARQLCQQWLYDCVQSTYFASLLRTMSTMLLHEGSARVSVQYIEFELVQRLCDMPQQHQLSADTGKQLMISVTLKDGVKLHHCTVPPVGNDRLIGTLKSSLLDETGGQDQQQTSRVTEPDVEDTLSPLKVAESTSSDRLCASSNTTVAANTSSKFRKLHHRTHSRYKQSFDQDALRDIIYQANMEDIGSVVNEVVNRLVDKVVELHDEVLAVDEEPILRITEHGDAFNIDVDYSNYKASDREDTVIVFLVDSICVYRNRFIKMLTSGQVLSDCIDALQETESGFQSNESDGESPIEGAGALQLFHPLHVHVLLYCDRARDCQLPRAKHLFTVLAHLLNNDHAGPIVAGSLISSSSWSKLDRNGTYDMRISHLMHSHMCAILGQTYWLHNVAVTSPARNKQYTFIEVLLTAALYYLRSYFLHDPTADVTEDDRIDNWSLKVAVLKFLCALLDRVQMLLKKHQSPGLCSHVFELMTACKLQKTMIHSLMVCVNPVNEEQAKHLSAQVISYNLAVDNEHNTQLTAILTEYEQCLLNVCASIVELEHLICHSKNNWSSSLHHADTTEGGKLDDVYGSNTPLAKLRIFLFTILKAFKSRYHHHGMWCKFVIKITPFLGSNVGLFIVQISEQLCRNVTICARNPSLLADETVPAAYVALALDCITCVQHYCLVDSSTQQPSASTPSSSSYMSASTTSSTLGTPDEVRDSRGATDFFTNIFKVFSFGDSSAGSLFANRLDSQTEGSAKQYVLSKLSDILATLCSLWQALADPAESQNNYLLSDKKKLETLTLDLLKPIALDYSINFLCALADVWCVSRSDTDKGVIDFSMKMTHSPAQNALTELMLSMKVMPLESMIRPLGAAVKQVTKLNSDQKDVALLEMLHACLLRLPVSAQRICWPALQTLIHELLIACDNASVTCWLFIIFVDHVRACRSELAITDERALQKSMQEVLQRLVEALNTIAGWQLEQSTWLKRTVVKDQSVESEHIMALHQAHSDDVVLQTPKHQTVSDMSNGNRLSDGSMDVISLTPTSTNQGALPTSASTSSFDRDSKHHDSIRSSDKSKHLVQCTQALCILSENVTDVVDSICKSDDKDKMLPMLYAVWANTLPYLKARKNRMNFLMSCKLLSALSAHSYTRTVWRKSAVELFFESNFFQMNEMCTKNWKTIIDNLIMHDKTASKELFTRLSPSQGVVPFMANKDSEYDMRAASVRRLAFIVYSSGFDQFQPHLADIQDRLTDHLRNYQVPQVYSQIFVCFRVLLVRLSPQYLLALWPSLITEMMQAFVLLDQHISLPKGQTPDEMKCHRDDYWFRLYLSACKLLHTLIVIPSSYLPHFQMLVNSGQCSCRYQWSFVSSIPESQQQSTAVDGFVPLLCAIQKKLRSKYPASTPSIPANWRTKSVSCFSQLYSFVYELCATSSDASTHRSRVNVVHTQNELDKHIQVTLADVDDLLVNEFSDGF